MTLCFECLCTFACWLLDTLCLHLPFCCLTCCAQLAVCLLVACRHKATCFFFLAVRANRSLNPGSPGAPAPSTPAAVTPALAGVQEVCLCSLKTDVSRNPARPTEVMEFVFKSGCEYCVYLWLHLYGQWQWKVTPRMLCICLVDCMSVCCV